MKTITKATKQTTTAVTPHTLKLKFSMKDLGVEFTFEVSGTSEGQEITIKGSSNMPGVFSSFSGKLSKTPKGYVADLILEQGFTRNIRCGEAKATSEEAFRQAFLPQISKEIAAASFLKN